MSQAVVQRLLEEWGEEGFESHINSVQQLYRKRRDLFCSLADRHLRGLAEWTVPRAGMFVWFNCKGITDTESLIKQKAVNEKVLMVPGVSFTPAGRNGVSSSFVRAAFSTATEEEMETALVRFSRLLSSAVV